MTQFLVNLRVRSAGSAGDRAVTTLRHSPIAHQVAVLDDVALMDATLAFSRRPLPCVPPVHSVNLQGPLRVDMSHSPSRRRMAGVCAHRTAGSRLGLGRGSAAQWSSTDCRAPEPSAPSAYSA
jgi:hypothetical protein